MRAELKSLLSWDADPEAGDLAAFYPADITDFGIGVAALIGPQGLAGEEQFEFTVCTPRWLARQPLQKGYAFQRNLLLLERWEPELVSRAIGDLCRNFEAQTWSEIAIELSRFGAWEFDNYRP